MIHVSDQYKEIMDRPVRNEGAVRIVFGVSDPDAPRNSTLSDNGHLYYSQLNSIDLGLTVTRTYETLERGRFVLSGKNLLAREPEKIMYQGFVSSVMSNDDGNFVGEKPTITIDFGSYYTKLSGLTLIFDDTMNNYVNDFTVNIYNNDALILTETHNPTSPRYVSKNQIPEFNKMEFIFNSTNIPHRRVRLHELVYGIVDTLTDRDISDCSLTVSADMFATELPTNRLDFTIFDVENKYNPDNPENLIQYLENGQSVKFFYGQYLDDESIEWIPMYTGYTTGEVSVSDSGFVKNISIKSEALLSLLDTVYHGGTYLSSGISLYDLANNLIDSVGYTGALNLSDDLRNITTRTLLNGKTIKEGLQLIANAGGMSIYIDRNGVINIKDMMAKETPVIDFNQHAMLQMPKSNRIPQLRNLSSTYYVPNIEGTASQLATTHIDNAVETEYLITFEEADGVTYSKTGSLTIVGEPVITASAMKVVCTGTGDITINGKKITYKANTISKKIHEIGIDLEIKNPLVSDQNSLNVFMDKVIAYYERRTDYTFENRGYPHLDIGDTVTNTSNYEGDKTSTLYYNQIKYNGSITGTSKTLEFNEVI